MGSKANNNIMWFFAGLIQLQKGICLLIQMWIFPCFFGLAAAQKTTGVKKGKREEFAGLHQVAEVLEEFGSGKKRSVTRLGGVL